MSHKILSGFKVQQAWTRSGGHQSHHRQTHAHTHKVNW